MADSQLAAYVTRANAQLSQFDDSNSDVIGKRAAIDKNTPQLINFTILANLGICNKYAKCYSIVDLRN